MTSKSIMPKPPVFAGHKKAMTDVPKYHWIHNINQTLWSSDSQPDLTKFVRADLAVDPDALKEFDAALSSEETRLDEAIAKLADLQDDHRDLMRAAYNFCVSELTIADMHDDRKIKSQLDDDPEWRDLWNLCKDYDPTNDRFLHSPARRRHPDHLGRSGLHCNLVQVYGGPRWLTSFRSPRLA